MIVRHLLNCPDCQGECDYWNVGYGCTAFRCEIREDKLNSYLEDREEERLLEEGGFYDKHEL